MRVLISSVVLSLLGVLPQHSLSDEPLEILAAFCIHRGIVDISGGREIDLWLAHMEKAQRITRGHLASLFRRHHVVRQLANARSQFRFGPQGGKGSNCSHKSGREDK